MIFFTSDQHIWHTNVIKYCTRPFATVEIMNEAIVTNWNSVVSPEDTVYCLGDFSMAARPVETFTSRLNGTKYLVPGNHDHCHSYHKKSRTPEKRKYWLSFYEHNGWIVLSEQITLDIPGIGVVNLCHHPYTNDDSNVNPQPKYTDKFAKWRPVDDGKVLLCGHIHEKFLTKKTPRGSLMINVGVDRNDFKPMSIDRIKELIECQNK